MIVDQIDIAGGPTLEAEDDAPVAGHRDRPDTREVALETVQVIEDLAAIFKILPRVEQPNIEVPKVLHITRDEGQVVLRGRRRDLRIGCGRAPACTIPVPHEAPPDNRGRRVKRQDAPVELPGEILFDPSLKSVATSLLPYLPRASDEFSDGLCRKEKGTRNL
jgi:hypothetical protein